jgi:tRNA uridine 5-carboxymethylaminomethyl modification enzyme
LESLGSSSLNQQVKLSSLITRPHITMDHILQMSSSVKELADTLLLDNEDSVEQAEILLKYEGYIVREEEVALKLSRLENLSIPESMDYRAMKSLSSEAKEKLSAIKPVTIGQASRVSGVSPSDISVLLIHLGR